MRSSEPAAPPLGLSHAHHIKDYMKKKRTLSAEHLAKLQAGRKKAQENQLPKQELPTVPLGEPAVDKQGADLSAMRRQIDEVMETNALLKAALLGNQSHQSAQGVGVGQGGRLLGEVDKYLIDPENYPNPTKRLAQEPRLQTIAFNHNYELEYDFRVRAYETKTGVNMREPEFTVTLLRVVLDDQGERVQLKDKEGSLKDKFYIARRLMFHEDPQAALVIARENNLDVDKTDEKVFLNEMRYIRVRDWLFDYLWPKPATTKQGIIEESVGGTLVQVYTKSSVEPSAVDFDALQTKV